MASLSLKNICKKYPGGVLAVNDFNLEIKDKEFIIMVGPSGCGKSTTLRMIAGLEEITSGELYIGDRLVNDVAPKDRDIAMVFQNYALYPHMTVFDNMAFGLKLRKTPKDEIKRRVEEAARILDIEHLLDRKPKALSGGQRQRVALGRAIVREPKVFLLDEPLSNLDAKLRAQMRTELSKLHQKLGTTFIYVTHDQTEAMTMADRIVVMKDGVIQQVDSPQNLYDYPCNMFVAGFIGSPQMNFVESVVIEKDGKFFVEFGSEDTKTRVGIKYQIPLPAEKIAGKGLEEYVGKEVIMGIRPEDVHDEPRLL
ncbi:MAG: sn-glycerol-3-phosphate ABC transporter ATP-binding protein UgpC, partial [Ruminococcaceae bacterium]|nr:sn-glycerol-3-phosphate ABC transporter ATP-binding protein UgpC [Oscillospiraceae bacterium]